MSKYFSILFLFILFSCYPDRQLLRIKENHPDLVSKKAAEWYPCSTIKSITDSSEYKKWINEVREVDTMYSEGIDTLYVLNLDTIQKYDTVFIEKNCNKVLYKYKQLIKRVPAVHDTITIEDEAKITSLTYQLKEMTDKSNDYSKKYTKSWYWIAWLLIIIICLLLAIKLRR